MSIQSHRKNEKDTAKAAVSHALLLLRNLADPLIRFEEVSIVAYHSISNADVPSAVPVGIFAAHLAHMAERGYAFISLNDCVLGVQGKKPLPRKAVAITFDDGYADFETAALPILERFKAPAAVFVVGDAVRSRAGLQNDIPLLREESILGLRNHPLVEIGYHSRTHPNLTQLSDSELYEECAPRYAARYFAYPGGNYSPRVGEVLKRAGYEAAFSIKPGLLSSVDDPLFFVRNVITRDLTLRDIDVRTTKAITWYRALRRRILR